MQLRYDLDPHWGLEEEFGWKAVRDALTDPKFFAL